jgi:predicted TIM-barrel fold metal-dependent hydrolase
MDLTRRGIIGAGFALSGGSLSLPLAAIGRTVRRRKAASPARRIDVHQHLLPPEFLAVLERHGVSAQWAPVSWTAEGALAMMDEHEIATGILSLSAPGSNFGDLAEAIKLTLQVNERQAALVQQRPDRFGMFACVPLPDIDASLEAIAHAYDHLCTDGVILMANSNGVYLGDPAFDPVMEELNRRHAVILVHPTALVGPPAKGIRPSAVDFLLDTTRAALSLVWNKVPHRFPNLRMILSHAGGFIPYAAYRVAMQSNVADPAAMLQDLSNFYFDTALSASPTVLPSLLPFAKPENVVFGSDWPYCANDTVGFFVDSLDSYPDLDPVGHAAINRKNAEALFPRLAFR